MSGDKLGGGRERLPYNLRPVLEHIRSTVQVTDEQLANVIGDLLTALEDDTVIDADSAKAILASLIRAAQSNSGLLTVVSLLDAAGSEAALREVERLEKKRRKS